MQPVLELASVIKAFPHHTAVDGVSLRVHRGEFFALVGPSGCGKTTLLRLISGLEQPTSGRVLLNSADVTATPAYRRDVSTVFQNYALFPHLNVFDNVAFGLRRKGATEVESRVRKALELVRLTGKERRKPSELSGGERQRTALARSIVLEPSVLLLDEPLSALDPQLRKQVRLELKSLQRQLGISFVFVTHDQEEALSLSDTIAVMNAGRIEQTGPPEDLYHRPGSPFVAGFLGAVNWIEDAAVRPEATRIAAQRPGPSLPAVAAQVIGLEFLGDRLQVHLKLHAGGQALARVEASERYQNGQEVYVWWNPSDELPIGTSRFERAPVAPADL
jgi:ABC-type Fe3+/spermidine/putrescine transport system ATPase subunit